MQVYVPPVFLTWDQPAPADLFPQPEPAIVLFEPPLLQVQPAFDPPLAVPAILPIPDQYLNRWDEIVLSPNPGGANLDLGLPAFIILGCFPPLRLRICGFLGLLGSDLVALRITNFFWSNCVPFNNEPSPEPGSARLLPR